MGVFNMIYNNCNQIFIYNAYKFINKNEYVQKIINKFVKKWILVLDKYLW